MEGFANLLKANSQQTPQLVADAILSVVDTAPGLCSFRTEVDQVGMGDAIRPMNEQLTKVTEALFTNFGMADMLTLNLNGLQAA